MVSLALASSTGRIRLAEAMVKQIREGLIRRCPHCGTILENLPGPPMQVDLPHGMEECMATQVLDS